MEVILSLLAAASLWYLIPMIVVLILIFTSVVEESGLGLVIFTVLFMSLGIGAFEVTLSDISANPWLILSYLSIYIVFGCIWAVFRWVKYCFKYYNTKGVSTRLQASAHKDLVSFWIFSWILDILVYFLKDMVMDIFNAIWKGLGGMFQKISDKIYDKVELGVSSKK